MSHLVRTSPRNGGDPVEEISQRRVMGRGGLLLGHLGCLGRPGVGGGGGARASGNWGTDSEGDVRGSGGTRTVCDGLPEHTR